MIGKKLCIALLSVVLLSGCIPDHWPEAWRIRSKPNYDKEPLPWCYRSLGEIDCYAEAMPGAKPDHRINAIMPKAQPSEPTLLGTGVITPAQAGKKPAVTELAAAQKKKTVQSKPHNKNHRRKAKTKHQRKTSAKNCPCDTVAVPSPPAAKPAVVVPSPQPLPPAATPPVAQPAAEAPPVDLHHERQADPSKGN